MLRNAIVCAIFALSPIAAWAQEACSSGFCGSAGACGFHCQSHHCPYMRHCQEGAPIIKIHCGCPKPICNPCNAPNFGYFQTCWSPWPFPPDLSHCPTPQGLAGVPGFAPNMPEGVLGHPAPVAPQNPMALPAPRKLN